MSNREPAVGDEVPGLRERRRIRTKLMVQAEALRLFADKGYDQTTTDDIAHAAAMSPRTFFRYFATKEDVVLWDEYDDRPFSDLFGAQHRGDPLVRLISTMRGMIADIYRKDADLLLARAKLSFTVPAIRARFLGQQIESFGPAYDQLAVAAGVNADDLGLRVMLAAMFAAMIIAVERWQRDDGRADLLQVIDEAMSALAANRPELRAAVAAAVPHPPASSPGPKRRR